MAQLQHNMWVVTSRAAAAPKVSPDCTRRSAVLVAWGVCRRQSAVLVDHFA
jgi:hypothetical protein